MEDTRTDRALNTATMIANALEFHAPAIAPDGYNVLIRLPDRPYDLRVNTYCIGSKWRASVTPKLKREPQGGQMALPAATPSVESTETNKQWPKLVREAMPDFDAWAEKIHDWMDREQETDRLADWLTEIVGANKPRDRWTHGNSRRIWRSGRDAPMYIKVEVYSPDSVSIELGSGIKGEDAATILTWIMERFGEQ